MELGYANVDLMLDELTIQQFREWQVFFNWRERQREEAMNKK